MKVELIGLAQKKPTFIGFMNIFTILKSDYWSPHSALFSKSGQNRESEKSANYVIVFKGCQAEPPAHL